MPSCHPIPIPPCPHPIAIPHPIQSQPWAMGGGHVAAGWLNPKLPQWPSRASSSPPHFHVELRGREHRERAKLLQNFLSNLYYARIVHWSVGLRVSARILPLLSCMFEWKEASFVQIQCLKGVAYYLGFEENPLTTRKSELLVHQISSCGLYITCKGAKCKKGSSLEFFLFRKGASLYIQCSWKRVQFAIWGFQCFNKLELSLFVRVSVFQQTSRVASSFVPIQHSNVRSNPSEPSLCMWWFASLFSLQHRTLAFVGKFSLRIPDWRSIFFLHLLSLHESQHCWCTAREKIQIVAMHVHIHIRIHICIRICTDRIFLPPIQIRTIVRNYSNYHTPTQIRTIVRNCSNHHPHIIRTIVRI